MKIGLYRQDLLAALEKVSKVASTSGSVSILSYFLIEAEGESIRLSATDQSVSLILPVEGIVSEPGRALLPAKEALQILKTAQESGVAVATRDNDIVSILCGTRWNLKTRSVDAYPELKFDASGASIEGDFSRDKMLTALNSVKRAMSTSLALAQIGIVKGNVRAGDGVWFQEYKFPNAPLLDMTVVRAAVPHLVSMLSNSDQDRIHITILEDGMMLLDVGQERLTVRPPAYEFPDLDKTFLVPMMANSDTLKVNRRHLIGAIQRVCITSEQSSKAVVFGLGPTTNMEVSARNQSGSSSQETVPVQWLGQPRKVILHHEYALAMLHSFSDEDLFMAFGSDQPSKPSTLFIRTDTQTAVLNQLRSEFV